MKLNILINTPVRYIKMLSSFRNNKAKTMFNVVFQISHIIIIILTVIRQLSTLNFHITVLICVG